ncbi:MAG: hypothetical protein FJ137_05300 [Deltaproteobacteria bacterium]|nr:hypothetical protein [Deltaproteobacteria bacterium]
MTVVVALLLRVVFRVVDAVVLAPRPVLWRAWWTGWRALPSPYATGARATAADVAADVDDDDLVYGEAFVTVAAALLRAHGAHAGSVVVDLGCGRGAALVGARALGAAARGVDVCRSHVDTTGPALRAAGVDVAVGDARTTGLEGATHVWLAWATWSVATRAAVTARLHALPSGAVVVAVVHAVDDDAFAIVARRRAPFSWGVADVVVQRRR